LLPQVGVVESPLVASRELVPFNDVDVEIGFVEIILEAEMESAQSSAGSTTAFLGGEEDRDIFLLVQIHLQGTKEGGQRARGVRGGFGGCWRLWWDEER